VYFESFIAVLTNGVLNHAVGTGTVTGGAFTESLFASSNDMLVQLSVDTVGNVVLPRVRLESVPFAIRALSAGGSGGLPTGILALSDTPAAPSGFTATGAKMFQS